MSRLITARLTVTIALLLVPLGARAQSDAASTPINQSNEGSTPRPDPTVLTTQQLQREIETQEKITTAQRQQIIIRLDAMDLAVQLLQDKADKSPTPAVLNEKIKRLEQLLDEKFLGVAAQFTLRDERTIQAAEDAKVALTAALNAQKEAVAEQNKSGSAAILKSETNTADQIAQQRVLGEQRTKATDDKIDDLKARIGAVEGRSKGVDDSVGYIVGAIGVMVAIASLFWKKP